MNIHDHLSSARFWFILALHMSESERTWIHTTVRLTLNIISKAFFFKKKNLHNTRSVYMVQTLSILPKTVSHFKLLRICSSVPVFYGNIALLLSHSNHSLQVQMYFWKGEHHTKLGKFDFFWDFLYLSHSRIWNTFITQKPMMISLVLLSCLFAISNCMRLLLF